MDTKEGCCVVEGRVYLAGPIRGQPDFNYPLFHEAAAYLREAGWEVVNPAEHFGGRTDLPIHVYLRKGVAELARCQAIALLPGWEKSVGAKLEYAVAYHLHLMFVFLECQSPMAVRRWVCKQVAWPKVLDEPLVVFSNVRAAERQP